MQVYGDDVTFPSAVVSSLYAMFYSKKNFETCAIEWSILRELELYDLEDVRARKDGGYNVGILSHW